MLPDSLTNLCAPIARLSRDVLHETEFIEHVSEMAELDAEHGIRWRVECYGLERWIN